MALRFGAQVLTGGAIDTMWSLFVHGPRWDGDIPSKAGRDQLVDLGLVARHDGWQWLTSHGAIAAIDAGYGPRKERWEREQRTKHG